MTEHPGVLSSPAPLATFEGFGEYYLDFTLYYWISDRILETKSEVALGVHDAIRELEIQPARPQQDVTVKMITDDGAAPSRKEPLPEKESDGKNEDEGEKPDISSAE